MTERLRRKRSGPSAAVTFSVLCFAVLAVVGAIIIARGAPTSGPVALPTLGALEIELPASVEIDESFSVSVAGAAEGEKVLLSLDGAYGLRNFEATSRSGVAGFLIEPSSTPGSGTIVVDARTESARGVATIGVVPGPAVDGVDVYVGPRTIVADNEDFSMVVAVPVDRLGNPTVAETPVDVLVTRSTDGGRGPSETISTSTSGLLAFAEIEAGIVAGRTTVAVDVESARGVEESFLEVADVPVDVELIVVGETPSADGVTLFEIQTSVLADQHGNVVPDGTIVHLHSEGATGRRRLIAPTVDGVATFVVEAPTQPGPADFVAKIGRATSESLNVEFIPAIERLPVQIVSDADRLVIIVGPVTGTDKGYVADGTVATVEVGATMVEVELESGTASIEIDQTAQPVSVSVLGVEAGNVEDDRK